MRARNGPAGWGWVSRLLHWVMAAVVLFELGLGLRMANFTPDPLEEFRLAQIHKSWGFVILVLALLRLGWRLGAGPAPAPPATMPRWQVRAAAASHAVLYALMLGLPISGWAMVSASPIQDVLGIDNTVFGLFAMPDPWVPGVEAVETAARAVHVGCALALALLLVLHVGAALKHALIDRDDVLARMTFGR